MFAPFTGREPAGSHTLHSSIIPSVTWLTSTILLKLIAAAVLFRTFLTYDVFDGDTSVKTNSEVGKTIQLASRIQTGYIGRRCRGSGVCIRINDDLIVYYKGTLWIGL